MSDKIPELPFIKNNFFTDMDDVIKYMSFETHFDTARYTHIIDFKKVKHFKDPIVSEGCIVIITSDGEKSTMSHINVGNDPTLFAHDLRELVGKDGVPVILTGGLDSSDRSKKLINELMRELPKKGFTLSTSEDNTDLLGKFKRRAIVNANEVLVVRESLTDGTRSSKRLSFH